MAKISWMLKSRSIRGDPSGAVPIHAPHCPMLPSGNSTVARRKWDCRPRECRWAPKAVNLELCDTDDRHIEISIASRRDARTTPKDTVEITTVLARRLLSGSYWNLAPKGSNWKWAVALHRFP